MKATRFAATSATLLLLGCSSSSSGSASQADIGADPDVSASPSDTSAAGDDTASLPEVEGFEAESVEQTCEHYELGPARPLTALASADGELPQLTPRSRAEVTLPAADAAFAGYVGVSSEEHSEVVLLVQEGVSASLTDAEGAAVAPEAQASPGAACDVASGGTLLAYHLMPGSYRLFLGPTSSAQVSVVMHLPEGEHEHDELPAEYATLSNPFANDTAAAAAAGKTLFDANCASCHGASGIGDGATGAGLSPAVADLTEEDHYTALNYLFYRISTGGESAPAEVGEGSAMPKYLDLLTSDERWRIVNYISYTLVPAQHPEVLE